MRDEEGGGKYERVAGDLRFPVRCCEGSVVLGGRERKRVAWLCASQEADVRGQGLGLR